MDLNKKITMSEPGQLEEPKRKVILRKALSLAAMAVEKVKKIPSVILIAAILVNVGFSIYSWYRAGALSKNNPQETAQEETSRLVSAISKLIILPEDETPTIATVTDLEKLKDQPFFARAKVGDKVLIYATARKAILYDPAANKIIEVAPINLGE